MTYANDKGCNNFVSQISAVMTEQLAVDINSRKYISLLTDGATDAGGKENQTVLCRYVKDGQPLNRLVGHKHLTKIYEKKAIKRGIQTAPVLLQDVSHCYYS